MTFLHSYDCQWCKSKIIPFVLHPETVLGEGRDTHRFMKSKSGDAPAFRDNAEMIADLLRVNLLPEHDHTYCRQNEKQGSSLKSVQKAQDKKIESMSSIR